jgi:hypothetical protein
MVQIIFNFISRIVKCSLPPIRTGIPHSASAPVSAHFKCVSFSKRNENRSVQRNPTTPGTQEITYSIEFTTPNPLTIIAAPIDMDAFPRDEPVSEGRLKEVVTNQVKAGVFPVNRRFVPITGGRLIRYATTREVIFET